MKTLLLLMAIVSYRDGDTLVVEMPPADYKSVEITVDPPAEFATIGDSKWAAETDATEGEFFAVVCSDGACVPIEETFQVKMGKSIPTIGLVGPILFFIYLWGIYGKMAKTPMIGRI